jgi:hypothetical protein
MKKILFAALLLLAMLFATDTNAQRIAAGIKAGINYSGINNYQQSIYQAYPEIPPGLDFTSEPYFNFQGGGFVNIRLTGKLHLQPELLYSQQGYHFSAPYTSASQSINSTVHLYIRQTYFNIPVLLQYALWKGVQVTAGPQLGFLSKGELVAELDNNKQTRDAKFSSIDLSVAFGAQYRLPLLPLGFYGRYTAGLNNINNDKNRNYSLKNQVAQLGVFYQFGK